MGHLKIEKIMDIGTILSVFHNKSSKITVFNFCHFDFCSNHKRSQTASGSNIFTPRYSAAVSSMTYLIQEANFMKIARFRSAFYVFKTQAFYGFKTIFAKFSKRLHFFLQQCLNPLRIEEVQLRRVSFGTNRERIFGHMNHARAQGQRNHIADIEP